jgi:nucleotide-binding universal stress UspA family protein
MAIRDILLHLDESPRAGTRLAIACDLAARHAARLTALYTIALPTAPLPYGSPAGLVDAAWIADMKKRWEQISREQSAKQLQIFEQRAAQHGLETEWRLVEDVASDAVTLHAQYADLAIVGQSHPGEASVSFNLAATVMLASGRPVLVVPYAGDFSSVGRTVLIGWKATREAARAVNDAIPLLVKADTVKVLSINPERGLDRDRHLPAVDMTVHLARHGIKAEATHTDAKEVSEGDILLNEAADMGADLIVVGGYGHSRARELFFSGVTRSLLSQMTVPVLFSH